MPSRFPLYERLIKLYPKAYRDAYGDQMVQTLADILADQPTPFGKANVWLRTSADLPFSIINQNAYAWGEDFMYKTPGYIKRNAAISAALLLPFALALTANMVDTAINSHNLYRSWVWRAPILTTWVLILPAIACLVALFSYAAYTATGQSGASVIQRVFDIRHTWPVLLTGACGLGVLFILQFHDSAHCWIQNPVYFATKFHQTWQCTTRGYLGG